LFAVAAVLILQLVFTYLPLMQTLFHSRALGVDAWLKILGAGMVLFLVVELEKAVLRRR
jgi:hypothetical protein